jgi:hypothetical protein
LGVDEHIWRPSRVGTDRAVTIMVDLTRDQDGCLHARLLDAVVGRSGTAYKTWPAGGPVVADEPHPRQPFVDHVGTDHAFGPVNRGRRAGSVTGRPSSRAWT